jgi:Tol biopolymer transport system component
MSMTRGTRFGSYEILALIGVGGMGEVYRANDPSLKRDVALKVLPESFVTDANRLARMQREAEMLASLNHANVAQIYGLERSGERTALVMELIEGPSLAERIAQGALPANEALAIAQQIASALAAAHERGIVHRDLKPANIKLKPDGTVKVLDFGIAKALDLRATSGPQPPALTTPAITEAGIVLGTAAYMPPEQARGKPVDKRADIWAFGCVLYEMLTGKAAFAGDDVTTTLARVLEREPELRALPAGLAPGVRRALELCLQKDPNKRLHDIGDVRLALEGELGAPPAAPLWRRAVPIAAAVVVGAVAAGLYVATLVKPATPAAAPVSAPVMRFTITPPASAPLADLGGYDVTISPDGKRIAYFAGNPETNTVSLYLRDLDGLDARLIAGTEVESAGTYATGNMNPFFSADGKSIGLWLPNRGVVRVGLDGAPPIKIIDSPDPGFIGASWAADDTLVYSSGRQLQRVSSNGGGTPKPLTDEYAGAVVASPVLLPGGKAVLFGLISNGVENVVVLDLVTRASKILIEGGQNPTYAASGHIVFARGTTLMAAPFSVAELAVTGEPVAMVQGVRHPNSQAAADYALSDNGTLVYVPGGSDSSTASSVVWVDRKGAVTGRAVNERIENPRDPRLSPDGTRLLLTTGSSGQGVIWSYDLGGRPPIRLAASNDDRFALWSPDGKQVIFTEVGGSGGIDFRVLPADGSVLSPHPLRTKPLAGAASIWTAAGDLVFVTAANTNADIVAISVSEEGEERPVVASEYAEIDPALSADGRWLAFASNRTGRIEIWAQAYPTGVPLRVSTNGGYEPHWAANGRELFYLQGNTIMVATANTDGALSFAVPMELFAGRYFADPSPYVRSYDVAKDGRFLMIQSEAAASSSSGSIVVVQNWIEELRRRVPKK